MTKKDYIAIAKILSKYDSYVKYALVKDFATVFEKDNPRFDTQKFYDACIYEGDKI